MSFENSSSSQGSEQGEKQFKSRPSQKFWIGEILEGSFNPETKEVSTRYGMVYRLRVMATVLEKSLNQTEQDSLFSIDAEEEESFMLYLLLDDGTGVIKANAWGVKEGDFDHIEIGDVVDIIGRMREYREKPYILLEVIHKIEDPNFESLRNLEIVKRRLSTQEEQIQTFEAGISMDNEEMEAFSQDTDFDLAQEIQNFDENTTEGLDELEGTIVEFIRQSGAQNGVKDEVIAEKFGVNVEDLNEMLNRLSQDLLVYRSGHGVWSAY